MFCYLLCKVMCIFAWVRLIHKKRDVEYLGFLSFPEFVLSELLVLAFDQQKKSIHHQISLSILPRPSFHIVHGKSQLRWFLLLAPILCVCVKLSIMFYQQSTIQRLPLGVAQLYLLVLLRLIFLINN